MISKNLFKIAYLGDFLFALWDYRKRELTELKKFGASIPTLRKARNLGSKMHAWVFTTATHWRLAA